MYHKEIKTIFQNLNAPIQENAAMFDEKVNEALKDGFCVVSRKIVTMPSSGFEGIEMSLYAELERVAFN